MAIPARLRRRPKPDYRVKAEDGETETWKVIPGFGGRYEASDLGNIRSVPWWCERIIQGRSVPFKRKSVVLKPRANNRGGYLQVHLQRPDGKSSMCQVHRLVLLAHVGPPPKGYQGCHFPDPDPTNNRVENLRWSSRTENEADKRLHGTLRVGEQREDARLTDDDVRAIRKSGETNVALAKKHGVSDSLISQIRKRKKWKHVE